eukprot:263746-Ditylum_brightwellii.AAC.1
MTIGIFTRFDVPPKLLVVIVAIVIVPGVLVVVTTDHIAILSSAVLAEIVVFGCFASVGIVVLVS